MTHSTRKMVMMYGGGRLAQALLAVLGLDASSDMVSIYDVDTSKATCDISEVGTAIAQSDAIFVCVPSSALEESIRHIAEYNRGQPVTVLTKGVTPRKDVFASEVLAQHLEGTGSILAGPMLAAELADGKTARAVCAGPLNNTIEVLFQETNLSITLSADRHGAAVCGVLKNIYSLGLGIAHERQMGDNATGVLVSQAVTEMRAVIEEEGGDLDTLLSVAGIGDLVATGTSDLSSNITVGRALARGGEPDNACEGQRSIEGVKRRCPSLCRQPLFAAIDEIVTRGAPSENLERII